MNSTNFFNLFHSMNNTTKLEDELNKLYWSDIPYYQYRLEELKQNYVILRNGKGQHKLTWRKTNND